jgi:hypothetical protein
MKLSCKDKKQILALALLACLASYGNLAFAQTITEIQQLDFGTIVVANTSTNRELILQPNNGYISDPFIYVMDDPQAGEYHVTGATPNAPYTISFDTTIPLQGGGTDFTLDDFTAMPATLITNASGEATFTVGATLTAISGGSYIDGNYDGQLDITITLDN